MDPTSKVMARLSGVILLVAGLGLASLVAWIVARTHDESGCRAFCTSVLCHCRGHGVRVRHNWSSPGFRSTQSLPITSTPVWLVHNGVGVRPVWAQDLALW
jgi:hypothetical protein